MSAYKVTIKVTETYTYDTDDAACSEDAIAQAFCEMHYWCREYEREEYSVTAELQELEVDK